MSFESLKIYFCAFACFLFLDSVQARTLEEAKANAEKFVQEIHAFMNSEIAMTDHSSEAKAIADELKKELLSHLQEAMREKGPVSALEVCSLKAIPLTEEVKKKSGILSLARITNKPRNPSNKISDEEIFLLEKARESQEVLIRTDEKNKQIHYYFPLKIIPACLTCHGDPAHMNPKLVSTLQEKYPKDQATGYKAGDLRGLIKVSYPR